MHLLNTSRFNVIREWKLASFFRNFVLLLLVWAHFVEIASCLERKPTSALVSYFRRRNVQDELYYNIPGMPDHIRRTKRRGEAIDWPSMPVIRRVSTLRKAGKPNIKERVTRKKGGNKNQDLEKRRKKYYAHREWGRVEKRLARQHMQEAIHKKERFTIK